MSEGKRWNIYRMREFIKDNAPRYKIISEQYKGLHVKYSFKCSEGHDFAMSWNNFRQGYRCAKCSRRAPWTIEEMGQFVRKNAPRYEILSEKYQGLRVKHLFKCPKEHRFAMRWNDFHQGHRCAECAKCLPWTIGKIRQFIEDKAPGYQFLSKKYQNAHTKYCFECPKNHGFKLTWSRFHNKNHRCPICKESKGEFQIEQILKKFNIECKRQYRIEQKRCSLRLDFFVPSLNLGIEYDGEQHFRPVIGAFGNKTGEQANRSFRDQQRRDQDKKRICEDLGIKLISIRFDEEPEPTLLQLLNSYNKQS